MGLQTVSVAFKKAAEDFIKRSSNDIAGCIVCVSANLRILKRGTRQVRL